MLTSTDQYQNFISEHELYMFELSIDNGEVNSYDEWKRFESTFEIFEYDNWIELQPIQWC